MKCGRYNGETVCIDYEYLVKVTRKAGYTGNSISRILGIAKSSYTNWKKNGTARLESVKRIADLLGIPVENFIKTEDTIVSGPDVVVPVSKLQEIGDTQNIHSIFEILNSNIIMLASMVQDMQEQLTKLSIPKVVEVEPVNVVKEKPIAFIVNKEEIDRLISGFDVKDTFEEYRKKVNCMISIIASYKKTTHKQVLHDYYKLMTNVYGVVYAQLKKDYYSKYQHKDSGSLELLYEEPIFREVFYNVLSSKLMDINNKEVNK